MKKSIKIILGRTLITLCTAVFALGVAAVHGDRVWAAVPKEDTIKPGDVVKLNEEYSSYWFKLTVDKIGIYTIESEGIEDPKVVLYESDKDTIISEADAGGENYNFKLSKLLNKGTYWYRVYQKHFDLLYDTTVKMTANTDDTILVKIDSTGIPDTNLKTYIDDNYDIVDDDVIRAYETADVDYLDIHNMGITSLKGVEAFSNLGVLYCSNNNIKTADLRPFTKLRDFSCADNPLESVDLSANTKLSELTIKDTTLKKLDISNNVGLTEVFIHENPMLSEVIVGDKPRMEYLNIENNAIEDLDLTGCSILENVRCGGNGMTSVNIKGLKSLYTIDLSNNYLGSIDLSGCDSLITLNLSNNLLKKLDVSKSTNIRTLYCDKNRLESLVLNGCKQINYLDCSSNIRLEKVDISDNPFLITVYNRDKYWDNSEKCYKGTILTRECFLKFDEDTKINKGSVDYSETVVDIDADHFPDGQFRKFVKNNIDKDGNGKLSRLEITGMTSITVSGQEIADLKGIEYFNELITLTCTNNPLTGMDLSKNTKLKILRCDNNKIKSLDLSKNTKLATLVCNNNKLTSIDTSKNPALSKLQCQKNNITKIDISDNPLLLKAYNDGTFYKSDDVSKYDFRDVYILSLIHI